MSAVAYTKVSKNSSFEDNPRKVEVGLGDKHLYFKNHGLFSENYLVNHLGKSKDSFLLRAWETEDLPAFSALYEWMLSTWHERRDEFEKMKEAQLEEEWIRPILQRLGWEYVVQPDLTRHGKRQIPDYALFDDASAKKKAMKSEEQGFFSNCSLVADAKAMSVDLDGKSLDNSNPSYQIMQYLTYTNKDWGILTNGRYWRLYSLKSKTKFRSYFEINVEKFLNGNTREDSRFKYFFNFFSRNAFAEKNAGGQSFIDIVFADGEQYALQVETELKDRAFELVEMIAKGFQSNVKASSEDDLKSLYSHSLYYLFRLIFILNCEAKGLLNISRQNDYFKYSLRNICNAIRDEFTNSQKWSAQPRSYNQIKDLFKLLASGDESLGVHGFGRDIFETGKKKFFEDNEIPDNILNEVLLRLSCQFEKKTKSWAFIDYQRLSIDHMGSIFEGLLEFKLVKEKSNLVLVNSSGERKNTGSYYTPDYIVDYITQETLAPLVKDKKNTEILKMKVFDPAMGSAHFLMGAVKFLEEVILHNINDGDSSLKEIDSDKIRWMVLHNCIYGVDINPLAVELAKFSLWMFTASKEQYLEPLDDQLICKNSLTQETFSDVDAIVGNPPYIRVHKQDAKMKQELKTRYSSVSGDFDAYVLFLENAVHQMKKDGRAGFIIPNKFMSRDYALPARKIIREQTTIDTLMDLGAATDIFDAAVYPSIVIYQNTQPSKKSDIRIANSGKSALDFLRKKIKWSKVSQGGLNDQKWELAVDDGATDVIQKIGELKPLSERFSFDLFCGTPRAKDYYEWSKFLAPGKPNGKSVVKYYVCKSIRPFDLQWGTKISSLGEKLEKATFKIDMAALSNQLKQRFKTAPKLLIRGNDYRLTACVDEEGSAFVGVYGLIPKSNADLATIACWSNSTLANYLFKRKNGSIGLSGGYFSVNAPHIESLPTPSFSKELVSKFLKVISKSGTWEEKIAEVDAILSSEMAISSDEMVAVYDFLGDKYKGVKAIFLAGKAKKKAA